MLDKLKKWIRAFKDDILAEEGAIALYNAHIEEFREDFHGNIQDHISTLKLLGFRSDEIDRIVLLLTAIVIGPEVKVIVGKERIVESVTHIRDEEIEHIEEFKLHIEILERLIQKIEDKF